MNIIIHCSTICNSYAKCPLIKEWIKKKNSQFYLCSEGDPYLLYPRAEIATYQTQNLNMPLAELQCKLNFQP